MVWTGLVCSGLACSGLVWPITYLVSMFPIHLISGAGQEGLTGMGWSFPPPVDYDSDDTGL